MTKLPEVQPLPFRYEKIPVDALKPDPNNARKGMSKEGLRQLSDDMIRRGVLQAPIVRPLKVAGRVLPGKYQIICGHRRVEAFGLTGGKEIECKVVDVDDVGAKEIQLVENLQREDLSAIEVARGYRDLQQNHGLTVDQIAAQVGKKRATVYSAIKLVDLVPAAAKALEAGELDPAKAELIAAMPQSYQAEVTQKALGTFGEAWQQTKRHLTYRELKELIRDDYMLKLKGAPFDIEDAELVPAAGACTGCPKRTGAQGEMFGDEKVPDLCQDKSCYQSKIAAKKRQVVAAAKEDEKEVLSAAESKKALSGHYYSDWVKLSEKSGHEKNAKTWGELVKGTELEPQFAVSETGTLVKVAKKADVRKALKAAGKKEASSHSLDTSSSSSYRAPKPDPEAVARQRELDELREKVAAAATAHCVAFAEKSGPTEDLLRFAADLFMRGWEGAKVYERRFEKQNSYDQNGKLFDKHFGKATAKELFGVLFERSLTSGGYHDRRDGYPRQLRDACELAGVDLKQLESELAPKPVVAAITWSELVNGGVEGRGKSGTKYSVYSWEIAGGGEGWFWSGKNRTECGPFESMAKAQADAEANEAVAIAGKAKGKKAAKVEGGGGNSKPKKRRRADR